MSSPITNNLTHASRAQQHGNSFEIATYEIASPTILTEVSNPEILGYAFSTWKKWKILIVVFLVQCSMNFNTSLYSNGQKGISKEFGVSEQDARSGAGLFLVLYAFGCELWAPWSEEIGRWIILQLSLFLVNLAAIPVAIGPNFATILAFRCLGGLFSAGGSITLGIVADMYRANDQQYAVAFVVLASVGGSIFGPIIGGFVEEHLAWRWSIWLQILVGLVVQLLHAFIVPETRTTSLLNAHAEKLRKQTGNDNIVGPSEGESWRERLPPKKVMQIWIRPFKMFVTEPIVLALSLLSGFSDALIFMGFQSFRLVYGLWNFGPPALGLTFIAIGLGYLLAYATFIGAIRKNIKMRQRKPDSEFAMFESRLWWMCYTAPCLPIGLVLFAWFSDSLTFHWILPVIATAIIGVANFAIYMGTIDYMVAAYGEYSASATGGNGFARDLLAGVLTWAAIPYYEAFKSNPDTAMFHLQIANTVLAAVAFLLVAAAMSIYFCGKNLRHKSKMAERLHDDASTSSRSSHRQGAGVYPHHTPQSSSSTSPAPRTTVPCRLAGQQR
ncbi:major facilitator superfamily domain-containing protein [Pseudomassariella vexata]|uniref:Major facilitator superfamily domain-containing protein n=1 Tax=Pseudomassariella vexata TaxID=1141098 RepID=A0A1Y2E9P7_9PEZI|nr:major facilitator superfamily domain-containing protein [Pseudomassariella vexata]ORY67585.1 major facilitator superfamily domain-containing protein [Pseudomassariella vexata]